MGEGRKEEMERKWKEENRMKMNVTTCICTAHIILFLQRINIGERCVNSINHFLELIANEVKALLGVVCNERMHLDNQVCVGREGGRLGGIEKEKGVKSGRREEEGRLQKENRNVA